jgi:hypothetical protein
VDKSNDYKDNSIVKITPTIDQMREELNQKEVLINSVIQKPILLQLY